MHIHAPNINSYRRLFATWDAPKNTYWGLGNRSCGFRIPSNEEHSMRIENRISGSDTNPYFVFAAKTRYGLVSDPDILFSILMLCSSFDGILKPQDLLPNPQ